jgi:hypothetical protein
MAKETKQPELQITWSLSQAILYAAYFFTIISEIVLGIRILLRLFAANPATSFVQFIYKTSADLLYPFRGIFPTPVIGNEYVLDTTAIFAIFMYLILLYLIESLVDYIEMLKKR